jgi:hypothetical protein
MEDCIVETEPKKYVVNCNPNLNLDLPTAIALRQKVMAQFPQSENYSDPFCFAIVVEDIDSWRVLELGPAIALSRERTWN